MLRRACQSRLCRYLRVIANETISVYSKGQNKPEAVKKPLARSVELVDANVKVRDRFHSSPILTPTLRQLQLFCAT